MFQTLQEHMANDTYTKAIHLVKSSGEIIGDFSREEALKQYGNWYYSSGYTEGQGKVSIWIFKGGM